MKKAFISALALWLVACNANNSGSDQFPNDSTSNGTRPMNPTDSTATANDKAYNTADTGASKGSITDSSAKHTIGNTANKKDSTR